MPITLSISSKNYEKLLDLEIALNSIDLISDFYILKFDSQNTQYKIIYNGSPRTFFNDLNNMYLDVVMENNVWTVK